MESTCQKDANLTLNDGVKLGSRLWMPMQGGPWPALLMRQPYSLEIASTVTYLHPSWWANHGYLVIIQDVRGQGVSEGTFNGFNQEASDTSQTHEWVRSLPECNGKLGTYGFSYQGLTQLLAEEGTPPPDCLAPAMTGLNEKEHWSCEGEAHWWNLGLAWGLQLAALKTKRDGNWRAWEELRRSLENESYLWDGLSLLKKYDPEGMSFRWLDSSEDNHHAWKIHKPLETWLSKPMLLIGGWWDPHLKGIIDLFQKSINSGGQPELHIGPASHLNWWEGSQQLQLNFFDKHLKSPKQKESRNVGIYRLWNITNSCWQNEKLEELSKNSKDLSWSLSSQGMACLDTKDGILELNSNGKGIIYIVHDPWRPVPSKGGHLTTNPGIVDRRAIDLRGDVATFTTKKFKKTIHLKGVPVLQVTANADKKSFDICVSLSIVNSDQTQVKQLSTGVLRIRGDKAVKSNQYKIFLQPLVADIEKNNRLRLSISGSSWPAIGINPGQDQEPCGAPGANCLVVTLTLNLSGSNFQIIPLINSLGFQDSL